MNTSRHDFFLKLQQLAQARLKVGIAHPTNAKNTILKAGPLLIDISRQVIDTDLIQECLEFAANINLSTSLENLFSGELVNSTEQRAALHWLLRAEKNDLPESLHQHFEQVQTTLNAMTKFCDEIIDNRYQAHENSTITDVVNLGVGGSDLGPRLAYDALKNHHNRLKIHFVANIDGHDLLDTLKYLNPAHTFFVVTSKTFSTLETLENTKVAQAWLEKAGIQNPGAHFAAATSRPDKAKAFGINGSRIFPMWDWVGGRYSLLSSVGLALMLGIGPKAFNAMRQGAREIDLHVQKTPLASNAAFLQACVGIIATNGLNLLNHGIIAYDSRLNLLPAYLQQLEMESNGKNTNNQGENFNYHTCPIIWGGTGTNTQHSFHQLLHQGTVAGTLEFLLPLGQDHGLIDHQAYLQANCLAQVDALVHGKSQAQVVAELTDAGCENIQELAPHKVIHGNKPCTIIGYDTLTPAVLGALIALYEQKVFIQAQFWNINPFDQWGVELGKQLCEPLFKAIKNTGEATDSRTQYWVHLIQKGIA